MTCFPGTRLPVSPPPGFALYGDVLARDSHPLSQADTKSIAYPEKKEKAQERSCA